MEFWSSMRPIGLLGTCVSPKQSQEFWLSQSRPIQKIVWTVPGFGALGHKSQGQKRWDWQSRRMPIPDLNL